MATANDTYTATGTEGSTLTRAALIGKTALLCFAGSYPLEQITSGTPTNQQFKLDNTIGQLLFGITLETDQVIQTIYK